MLRGSGRRGHAAGDVPEALTHILEHPNVALLPFIPEGVAIIPPMLNGLSELNGTDRPVAEVMAEMGAGVDAIMTEAGYPKPFPASDPSIAITRIPRRIERTPSPDDPLLRLDRPPPRAGACRRSLERSFLVLAAWPALVMMLAVTAIPFAITIGLAFTNYDLVRERRLALRRPRQLRPAAGRPADAPDHLQHRLPGRRDHRHPDGPRPGPRGPHGAAIRGIGIIRTLYLVPIMTAPDRGRPDLARDVQQRRGLDQLLPEPRRAAEPVWLGDPLWPCPS